MNQKILICDDEPHIRLLIQHCLEELEDDGVVLLTASNGDEALAAVEREAPEMVILDAMIPKLNGFHVCERIKLDPHRRSAYVLLLTARGQEMDRRKAERVRADRYMTKPFDPDELRVLARRVLGLDAA